MVKRQHYSKSDRIEKIVFAVVFDIHERRAKGKATPRMDAQFSDGPARVIIRSGLLRWNDSQSIRGVDVPRS